MSHIGHGGDRTKLTLAWPGGDAGGKGADGDAHRADEMQQAAFFATLSRTGDVEQSCRAANMSVEAVWALHSHDVCFRRQWHMAVDRAYAQLELHLLAMALGGVTSETVTETDADGVRRQTTRRDLPGLARQMLQAHRQALAARAATDAAGAAAGGDGHATLIALAAEVRMRIEKTNATDGRQ